MKQYNFVRETNWDDVDEVSYDLFYCLDKPYLNSSSEHDVFRSVLLEQGVIGFEDLDFIDSLCIHDLERMALESNIYINIEDEMN